MLVIVEIWGENIGQISIFLVMFWLQGQPDLHRVWSLIYLSAWEGKWVTFKYSYLPLDFDENIVLLFLNRP